MMWSASSLWLATCALGRRNSMSVEMLERLVFINKNWPDLKEEKMQAFDEDNLLQEDKNLLAQVQDLLHFD